MGSGGAEVQVEYVHPWAKAQLGPSLDFSQFSYPGKLLLSRYYIYRHNASFALQPNFIGARRGPIHSPSTSLVFDLLNPDGTLWYST